MASLDLAVNSSGAVQGFNQATSASNKFIVSVQAATKVARDFAGGFAQGVREGVAEYRAANTAVNDTANKMNAADKAARSFADTLTRRLIVGYAVTQLRNLGSTLLQINAQFAAFGDISSRLGASTNAVGGLSRVAGANGVDTQTLLKDITAFAGRLDESRQYAAELGNLFHANGLTIRRDVLDNLEQVADLVRNARTEWDKLSILQQAGISATRENVRLYEQGGAALRAQVQAATDPAFENLARQAENFSRKWNIAWTNFKQDGQSAFLSLTGFFSRLSDEADQFLNKITNGAVAKNLLSVRLQNGATGKNADFSDFSGIDRFISDQGGKSSPANNPQVQIAQMQLINQRISLLGDLATKTDLVTQKQNELNIASLNGVSVSASVRQAIISEVALKKDAADASVRLQYGLATEADIRKQILASIPPAQRAIAEQTEAYRKQTEQLRMNNEVAAAALPGLKQLELQSKDIRIQLDQLGQGITNGISGPLVDLASGATKAGDAFRQMGLNVIRSIEQMIVNMTIAAPIARGLMSILSPFTGASAVSASVGVPSSLGALYADGGVQSGPGISAFSNQIVDRPTIFPFAKGIGLMGEAGAEAIMPLTRIGGKLGVRADGAKSGDTYIDMSGMQISLPEDPNGNDPTGATRASSVAKALEGTVRGMVRSELIKQQRPGGDLNRASAI
jgi:lambda family phage tail tape measure protein